MPSFKCITTGLFLITSSKRVYVLILHFRDSTKYRTPYAPWGGFTNGYEGSLRAHLLQTPDALFGIRKQSLGLNGTTPGLSSLPQQSVTGASTSASPNDSPIQPQVPLTHHISSAPPALVYAAPVPLPSPFGTHSTPPMGTPPPMMNEQSNWRSSSIDDSNYRDDIVDPGTALHPAIRAHYAAILQNRNVKVENQSDNGTPTRPLAMIPALPTVTSFSRPASRYTTQSKSATPVPPPSIPVASSASQNTAVPASSVKAVPAVPKRTYIPAPRPWETLRKTQAPAQPAVPHSAPPAPISTSPALMTPSPQDLPVHSQSEFSRHLPNPGGQPNRVVSGPFRQTFPATVPNSYRLNVPAFSGLPYSSPPQPSHHDVCSPWQYRHHHHQQPEQDWILPPMFQGSNPLPYPFPQ
jgi:hypothetical protein